jgi:serine/threonine protein kinase
LLELLEVLHQRGVLHGHLGPRSVMIQADADVALTGFGPVRLGEDPGVVVAPQVSWGEQADPGADLYALGALLRKLAWSGEAPLLGSAADDPLTAVLTRSQESPERRFRSVDDMRRALLVAVRGRAAELTPRGEDSPAATQVLRRDELLESWKSLDDEPEPGPRVAVASDASETGSRWLPWLLVLLLVGLLAVAGWWFFLA